MSTETATMTEYVNNLVEIATERGADSIVLTEGKHPDLLYKGDATLDIFTLYDQRQVSGADIVSYQIENAVESGAFFVAGTSKHARQVEMIVDRGYATNALFMSFNLLRSMRIAESGDDSE